MSDDMVTMTVDEDEWYPVFSLSDHLPSRSALWKTVFGKRIDLTPEQLEWVTRVAEEFDNVQEFLAANRKPPREDEILDTP